MKRTPPPSGGYRRGGGTGGFVLNPIWVLMGLNLLFFIATTFNEDLIFQLGLIPTLFTEQPWTLLSAMFIHASFWHLLGNMITLYFFGTALYHLIGQNKFLLLYFSGGIIGNLLYLWLGNDLSIAVGASGAIFAVAGALAVLVPKLQVRVYFVIPMPLWAVVIIFFGLWSIPGFVSRDIAWQAHLGGLVTGAVAGYFLRRSRQRYYIW
jgi:membrane associated rhomboid family serine protease